jgi:hypothetical protein
VFARTNVQTIAQRAAILAELCAGVAGIGELCCGDCSAQWEIYRERLSVKSYRGLDINPDVVAANRARGIECFLGDVRDPAVLAHFLKDEAVFFGPPLSVACDGHRLLAFREVRPGFADFAALYLGALDYHGLAIFICPNSTTMGDIRRLYEGIKQARPDVGLRLIHDSWSTVTGHGEETEPRLKYRELWFSARLPDRWEFRTSGKVG